MPMVAKHTTALIETDDKSRKTACSGLHERIG
jgi:hypothetical protein